MKYKSIYPIVLGEGFYERIHESGLTKHEYATIMIAQALIAKGYNLEGRAYYAVELANELLEQLEQKTEEPKNE